MATNAIQTQGLGKRYRQRWALRDCSVNIPSGRITALVGPNGAGKTTLLKLLASQSTPTTGTVRVFDSAPTQSPAFLADIGYVAQDIPLYTAWSPADHFAMGAHMNLRWDDRPARQRLSDLNIPLDQPVGTMIGGQRAQIGLALALAKQPKLLLLDEPVAALDPLARHDFFAALAEAATERGLSIVLSSHILTDLERICDYLVILGRGEVKLSDDTDHILRIHRELVGPKAALQHINPAYTVVHATHTEREFAITVRSANGTFVTPPGVAAHKLNLEEISLAYMQQKTSHKGVTA